MKIRLDGYTIALNVGVLKSMNKSDWINDRIKELSWTGIAPERLFEKLTELYELVNGAD